MNRIAKKISEFRKIKGLTQEELAEQAKINLRTVQRIENSESAPRGKTLALICEVLEIDMKEFITADKLSARRNIGTTVANGFFLIALNIVLISIIGFLTLDSNATVNSVFAGYVLSLFLPFFIVTVTKRMNSLERTLKFGMGYFIYFLFVFVKLGFGIGFVTGLFPCLLISISILYFGNALIQFLE